MTPDEIKQLVKDYIKENINVCIEFQGYNEDFLAISITVEGEEVASDIIKMKKDRYNV